MTTPPAAKAVREGYAPPPFFFREEYQPGEHRWTAWTGALAELKTLFFRVLECFPEEVEVLLKVERENASPRDPWQRYCGTCSLEALVTAIRAQEELVFRDGGSQVCVRCAGGSDYVALDEHGIFFLYTEEEGFANYFRELGFEERREPLLYESGHWHVRPPQPEEQWQGIIEQLKLTAF